MFGEFLFIKQHGLKDWLLVGKSFYQFMKMRIDQNWENQPDYIWCPLELGDMAE